MLKKFVISAMLLCGLVFADTQVQWIWSAQSRYANNETVFFRYDFDLPADCESGRIGISGDDNYKVYVNGKLVADRTTFRCAPVDAAGLFKKGHNCVTAAVTNVVSQAGFLFFAEYKIKGETEPRYLKTDSQWLCKIAGADDKGLEWTLPTTPRPKWNKVKVVRKVTEKHTWRDRIVLQEFMSEDDFNRFKDEQVNGVNRMKEIIAASAPKIAAYTAPKSIEFTRHNNLPFIAVDGKETPFFMYNALDLDPTKPEHFLRIRRFYDAGFRVFYVGIRLEQIWKQDGSIDSQMLIDRINSFMAAAPDAYLDVAFRLYPPQWYLKAHPEEMIEYGSKAERVLAGDELKTPIMRPSMASEPWKEKTAAVLRELIAKIEATQAGRRIIMYHVNNGIYSEWHYYGMVKELPDYSKAMQKRFSRYLKEKYKTDAALQKAWKDKKVTLATATIPTPAQRTARKDGDLFQPGSDCRTIDFVDCMETVVMECQSYFNGVVRKASKHPVKIGNYSGYFFGMQYPAFGWHGKTPQILRTDAIDYHSSPYAYAYRATGASGLPRGVFESYALNGKVALMESDVRTHLASDGNTSSQSQAQTDGMMVRDFCNAITRGVAMWYFDFMYGWYDHPHYLETFGRMIRLWQSRPDVTRVSEICMVCDYDSVKYHTADVNPNNFTVKLLSDLSQNMFKAGAPFDTVYIEDLSLPAMKQYKLYVFPNLVNLTDEKAQTVEKLLKQGANVAFLCGPQAIERFGKRPNVHCIGNAVNNIALHDLYKKVGIHCYTEDLDACLYASKGLVGFHRAAGGSATITLPSTPKKITQVFPEEKEIPAAQTFQFTHPHAGTSLFRIE